MKKLCDFILRLIGLGVVIGGAFAYLKNKGYITVSNDNEDEDYDDFSTVETEGSERTYINVDTEALKAKAMKKVKDASKCIAHALEKVWYEAEDTVEETVEKVEEFFNDEN